MLAVALVLAGRLRTAAPSRGAALEAVMLVLAAMLPVYAFWISPALASTGSGALETAVTLAYPVMDLILIAAGMRLAMGAHGWSFAGGLLAAGLLANVIVDGAYNVQVLNGTYVAPSPLDAGWLFGYIAWGAAALHPSAASLLDPRASDPDAGFRQRALFLALLFGSPLLVIAVSYAQGEGLDLFSMLGAISVISVIMAARVRDIARSGSRRWRAHALLYGMGVLVVLLAVAITNTRAASQRGFDTALALVHAQGSLERLGGIEADAHASERSPVEARRGFLAGLRSVREAIPEEAGGFLTQAVPDLQGTLATYRGMVLHELSLLYAERRPAALRFHDKRVTPAFERLRRDLATSATSYRSHAARTASAERASTVILVTLGVLILLGLLRRFATARLAADRAQERSLTMIESESRFRAMVAGSRDILTLIDADSRIIGHPETVEQILGRPGGTLLGARITDFLGEQEAAHTLALLQRLAASPGAAETIDWCLDRADGSAMTVEASIINHLDDPRLGGFVLNVRDVSERKRLEAALEHRAFHDHLTGLPNRALLEDRLRTRSPGPRASLGAAGVALTRSPRLQVGQRLARPPASGTRCSSRSRGGSGGSCAATTRSRAWAATSSPACSRTSARGGPSTAAQRRRSTSLVDPYEIAGHTLAVSASAGLASPTAASAGSGGAGGAAAAQRGPGDVRGQAPRRRQIELSRPEMHDAVARQLQLQVRAAARARTRRVRRPLPADRRVRRRARPSGSRRWCAGSTPSAGSSRRREFIPVAEQTGLIVDLGRFVLQEATRQLAEWDAEGFGPHYVSVNVAGVQLQRAQFVAEVAAALTDSGIAPERLLLELTESALIAGLRGQRAAPDARCASSACGSRSTTSGPATRP